MIVCDCADFLFEIFEGSSWEILVFSCDFFLKLVFKLFILLIRLRENKLCLNDLLNIFCFVSLFSLKIN